MWSRSLHMKIASPGTEREAGCGTATLRQGESAVRPSGHTRPTEQGDLRPGSHPDHGIVTPSFERQHPRAPDRSRSTGFPARQASRQHRHFGNTGISATRRSQQHRHCGVTGISAVEISTASSPDTSVQKEVHHMAIAPQRTGIGIRRHYTTAEIHPYDQVVWERRDARITNYRDGTVAFEQFGVEVPESWSLNATNILAQKYFRGTPNTDERESSLRQVADRVVDTVTTWGIK